jgi:predicted ATP-grasp superfamily ATP-dependent carboligase
MVAPVALLLERPAAPRDDFAAPPNRSGGKAPAVVVGADINGLGVVRSLARKGVPTWLLDCDPKHPTMRTRHAAKVAVPALGGAALIEALLRLRGRFAANPVLFLTREETVAAVSEALDRIAPRYRISLPDARLMCRLTDKVEFQALAQQHGFAIPRAVRFGGPADLATTDAPSYPCVLKPAVKTARYASRFQKAYKVEGRGELEKLVREIDGAAEMIAQEWIEGGDGRLYFCLQYRGRDGGPTVSFTGRKLRSWPPATGGTASCVPAPEAADELSRLTQAFFAAVGFFGIGSMEFKQDAKSGRYLMIEPTVGRTDFQEEIATLNGVNIPYAAYCGELGRDFRIAAAGAAPAAWAESRIDRWSSERQASPRRFPRGLRRYDALWRFDDPMPWSYGAAGRLRARLSFLRRARP